MMHGQPSIKAQSVSRHHTKFSSPGVLLPFSTILCDCLKVNPVLTVAQVELSFARFSAICGENLRRVHSAVILFCEMKLICIITYNDIFRTSEGTHCASIR